MFARITTFYTADPSPHWEPELIHRLMVRALEVLPQSPPPGAALRGFRDLFDGGLSFYPSWLLRRRLGRFSRLLTWLLLDGRG